MDEKYVVPDGETCTEHTSWFDWLLPGSSDENGEGGQPEQPAQETPDGEPDGGFQWPDLSSWWDDHGDTFDGIRDWFRAG